MRPTLLWTTALLALTAWLGGGCQTAPREGAAEAREGESLLLWIEAGETRLGLLPEQGGRAVVWRSRDGENRLDARPETWAEPRSLADAEQKVEPPWAEDFGQIVWMGPQSEFWVNQDAFPRQRDGRHVWPPDPYLTQLPYEVVMRRSDRLVLRSVVSPVWGVQLTKFYQVRPDGSVRFEVEAHNPGPRTITRNLWLNFRAPPGAREFVPVAGRESVSLSREAGVEVALHHGLASTWVPDGAAHRGVKASITPAEGWIAAAVEGGFLVLEFDPTDPAQVPPGHAPVEIYRVGFGHPELSPLLELEQHGPLLTLQPGERASRGETWRWLPAPGIEQAPVESQAAWLARWRTGRTR